MVRRAYRHRRGGRERLLESLHGQLGGGRTTLMTMSVKTLVTGGAGFIGSSLVRRLLELGFAAARKPRVLIADEPLRGLAPRASEAISDGLRRIAAAGCAVLVTGHETRPLLELGDHIVWMTGGTTHHLGDRRAALAHDQFRGSYLRDL